MEHLAGRPASTPGFRRLAHGRVHRRGSDLCLAPEPGVRRPGNRRPAIGRPAAGSSPARALSVRPCVLDQSTRGPRVGRRRDRRLGRRRRTGGRHRALAGADPVLARRGRQPAVQLAGLHLSGSRRPARELLPDQRRGAAAAPRRLDLREPAGDRLRGSSNRAARDRIRGSAPGTRARWPGCDRPAGARDRRGAFEPDAPGPGADGSRNRPGRPAPAARLVTRRDGRRRGGRSLHALRLSASWSVGGSRPEPGAPSRCGPHRHPWGSVAPRARGPARLRPRVRAPPSAWYRAGECGAPVWCESGHR